jgi:hypothetical protein
VGGGVTYGGGALLALATAKLVDISAAALLSFSGLQEIQRKEKGKEEGESTKQRRIMHPSHTRTYVVHRLGANRALRALQRKEKKYCE